MSRQIMTNIGGLPTQALENRIAVLEKRVASLTEAVRTLVVALEGKPLDSTGPDSTEAAARRAHQLLLSSGG